MATHQADCLPFDDTSHFYFCTPFAQPCWAPLSLSTPPTASPPGRSEPSCSLCSSDSSPEVACCHIFSLGGIFLHTYLVSGASWPRGAVAEQGQVPCRGKALPQLSNLTFFHSITAKSKLSLCISSHFRSSAANTSQQARAIRRRWDAAKSSFLNNVWHFLHLTASCPPWPHLCLWFFIFFLLLETAKPKRLVCDWFKYHPISLTCTDRAARANYIHLVMWSGFRVVNILWQHARPAAAATRHCSYIIPQPRTPHQKHSPEYTLSQVATAQAWKMRSGIPRAVMSLLLKMIIITLTLRGKKEIY